MEYSKVSMHGYSQEVRIPKKFRFNTDKVTINVNNGLEITVS